MNTGNKSSRKLVSISGDPFYPPGDRDECIAELSRRISKGEQVF